MEHLVVPCQLTAVACTASGTTRKDSATTRKSGGTTRRGSATTGKSDRTTRKGSATPRKSGGTTGKGSATPGKSGGTTRKASATTGKSGKTTRKGGAITRARPQGKADTHRRGVHPLELRHEPGLEHPAERYAGGCRGLIPTTPTARPGWCQRAVMTRQRRQRAGGLSWPQR